MRKHERRHGPRPWVGMRADGLTHWDLAQGSEIYVEYVTL
jgi:hypothetical protein